MTRSPPRAGFVVVAVLAVASLLAGLVAAVSMVARAGLATARVEVADLSGDALLRAGLEVAAYQLITLGERIDAVDGQLVRLDDGTVTLFVLPTGGWIDLNGSGPELLEAAYAASGLRRIRPRAFAQRVLDWRDADDEPGVEGAEADAYEAEGLSHRPANDSFLRVDDLAYVLGVDPRDVPKLAPLLTVYNPAGKVNLFDAPEVVLRALPGFRRQHVDRIVRLRRKRTEAVAAQLLQVVPAASEMVTADVRPDRVVRVRVEARPDRSAARTVEVVMMPDPLQREPYRIADWREIGAGGG